MSRLQKSLFLILLVLVFDQVLKIWIKTHMMLGDEVGLFSNWANELEKMRGSEPYARTDSWARIHFTENNGMAFGLELAGEFGKIILSLFRIVAVFGIGYYIYSLYKEKAPQGLILSISLIMAGAIGNIIDSAFYGMIFNESTLFSTSTMFPDEGGYSSFLHGKVVDMFYFPLIDGHLPSWFPVWPNKHIIFFRPVFNVADSAITVGVSIILIFQKRFFKHR